MKARVTRIGILALALCAPLGCSDDASSQKQSQVPTSGPVNVFGRVGIDAKGVSAEPLVGGSVTIRGDFDGDGTVGASEVATATTDAKGQYQVTFEMKGKGPLVARFEGTGVLGNTRRVIVAAPSYLQLDAVVTTGQQLENNGVFAALPDGGLRVRDLPDGYAGVARRYDPTSESFAFPGTFVDDKGAQLKSAVFAKVELQDAQGQAVHELPNPGVLELEVPKTTWRVIRDTAPGNDRIEVPYYAFDEDKGQWVMESQAYLADEKGSVIPEAQLAAITSGSYTGKVTAVATVTHFSTGNVDFPSPCGASSGAYYSSTGSALEQCSGNQLKGKGKVPKSTLDKFQNWLACLFGLPTCEEAPKPKPDKPKPAPKELKDFEWHPPPQADHYRPGSNAQAGSSTLVPLSGATITADFFYADGTPAGYVVGEVDPDGSFDIPIGRSEAPGEDVDGNGIAGEVYTIRVVLEYGSFRFVLAQGEVPDFDGMVADLGSVDLSELWVGTELCTVKGKASYLDGSPANGANVALYSLGSVDLEDLDLLCGPGWAGCTDTTATGSDGAFSLTWPVSEGTGISADLDATSGPTYSWYWGNWTSVLDACPASSVDVVLDYGYHDTELTLDVTPTTIAWDPAKDVTSVAIYDANGDTRWVIASDASLLKSPITFGTVPAGAVELNPPTGQMAAGDYVYVDLYIMGADGYTDVAHGEATVP